MKRFIAALALLAAVAGFGTQAYAQSTVSAPPHNILQDRSDPYANAP